MKKKSKNNNEYSTTGFSDLVGSPFFYSVLLITFILGFASVYGFFQNPRKLKLIIDVISQRVFISEVEKDYAPTSVNNREYSISHEKLQLVYRRDGNITTSSLEKNRYSIFAEEFVLDEKQMHSTDSFASSDIDYSLLSPEFREKINLIDLKVVMFGTQKTPHYILKKDIFRYSLRGLYQDIREPMRELNFKKYRFNI